MIKLMDIPDISEFLCTLQEASRPDDEKGNGPPVIDSQIVAIDFDKFTKKYAKKFGEIRTNFCPKSADSLYQSDTADIYIVEFKKSRVSGSGEAKLKLKATETLLTLMDLSKIDRCYAREHIEFIFVFNETKTAQQKANDMELNRIGKSTILCGLGRLKDIYFKSVKTLTSAEFSDYIQNNGWTSMVN